jgi:hypothetical protein
MILLCGFIASHLTFYKRLTFTANHLLSAVQTICLSIYVRYNIGESDRLCVSLAGAGRPAHLQMHRLGADDESQNDGLQHEELMRAIVDREVQKRAWYFLIG